MKRVYGHIIGPTVEMEATYGHSVEPVPFDQRLGLDYRPIKTGTVWGTAWENAWFKLRAKVPAEWKGKKVVAQMDFSGEALVFSEGGTPIQGLTKQSIYNMNWTRENFPLYENAEGGEEVFLWVEATANHVFGIRNANEHAPRGTPHRYKTYNAKLSKMRLAVMDPEMKQFYLDLYVLFDLYKSLPEKSTRAVRIFRGINDAIDAFADNPDNVGKCREILRPLLEKKAHESATTAISVGHAHIDTGWFWPVSEARRKCARSFSNQIGLMDKYPEYVFGASQAAHYQMVKEDYPDLYAKIKEYVAEGRWEPQGGMWVEADCNVTSGESLVRQFLHGKNFFKDEFDFEVKSLWLPDVFGYSAALPQIMKLAGCDYFLTQKISWSQFNEFPHTTFNWRGIDGSEVLTHFPPENFYNSWLVPNKLIMAEENFREREVLDEMLVLFGMGDGGGGAKASHIERGRRQQNLEGVPKVKFGRSDEFFERLSVHRDELATWSGELYLELHRGTLTSQARTKKGNRLLEKSLRETEYLLSCGDLSSYPLAELDRVWKTMLINQFHDIIPGSSIREVYEVSEKETSDGMSFCQRVQGDVADRLFDKEEDSLVLVNTLNIPFTQSIELPRGWNGAKDVKTQVELDGKVVASVEIPSQGMITLKRSEEGVEVLKRTDLLLENDLVCYTFDENGQIVDAYDKVSEKNFLSGPGNVLTLYEDRPNNHDAWDIDIFYENQALETAKVVSYSSLGCGVVKQGLRFDFTIGKSTLIQEIYLESNSKRLDFKTNVDWQDRHRMLRVAFPTTIRSDQASFDIQYGHVQRPTHRNLSWDMARFEVCAHKYADLSDRNYGVALLNDCKYGYKVLGNVIDLNLLRGPTTPDPDCDLDDHEFTYSLLPHVGDLITSDVMDQAIQLNQPPLCFEGRNSSGRDVPVKVSGKGVTLEVLKKAEKEECLVLRLVERLGSETKAQVTLTDDSSGLVETDLMEWSDIADHGKGSLEIPMKAFEIKTFKIRTA